MLKPAFAQQPSSLPLKPVFGFGEIETLGEGTSKLVQPMFAIATVLVVVYFLIAAFKYLKAGGNKEDVEGARQMITHSIVGFAILMLAFLILQFLLATLFGINNLRIIG